MAYVTEDRKAEGLILIQDVKTNITIANLKRILNYGLIDANAEIKDARHYADSLDIKTPSIEQKVLFLSGGNQQKVSLAKWLYVRPDVMILDEPTRGIDVGAKFEIFTIMNKLVDEGMSIIMISSELPEILSMTDRIYVVSSGRITAEINTKDADQETIMRYATM
jgi:putative multiple sugar transport system ATP-binding protein